MFMGYLVVKRVFGNFDIFGNGDFDGVVVLEVVNNVVNGLIMVFLLILGILGDNIMVILFGVFVV